MLPSTDQDGRGRSAGDRASAADAADNFKNRRRVRGVFVKDFVVFMIVPPSLLLKSSVDDSDQAVSVQTVVSVRRIYTVTSANYNALRVKKDVKTMMGIHQKLGSTYHRFFKIPILL